MTLTLNDTIEDFDLFLKMKMLCWHNVLINNKI